MTEKKWRSEHAKCTELTFLDSFCRRLAGKDFIKIKYLDLDLTERSHVTQDNK